MERRKKNIIQRRKTDTFISVPSTQTDRQTAEKKAKRKKSLPREKESLRVKKLNIQ